MHRPEPAYAYYLVFTRLSRVRDDQSPIALLALQRMVGNRHMQRLLAQTHSPYKWSARTSSYTRNPSEQGVSQAHDKYADPREKHLQATKKHI